MSFAFLRICCLPRCPPKAFIHEHFVNRGVLAAACSRLGRLELPWQGRGRSIRPSCAAGQVLEAQCQHSHAMSSEALCCSQKRSTSPRGVARDPCLSLKPHPHLYVGQQGLQPQGALCSTRQALTFTHHMHSFPPQSIPPVFTKMT